MLLDPRFWLAFIAWTIGVALFANNHGAKVARADEQAIAKVAMDTALNKRDIENEAILALERKLRDDERLSYNHFLETLNHEKAETDRTLADLRHDVIRLRVPTRRPDPATGQAPAGGPAAAGTGEEGHADLAPDAAEFVVGLLARGDEAIIKHAEVVDRYERLRLACSIDPASPIPKGSAP